jgi:hypothetical protein
LVGCHLKTIRDFIGPFTNINTYVFESSYGDLRRHFIPGTPNTCKQIMKKTLMRKFRPHPSCTKKVTEIKPGRTSKSRDDLVYVYENGHYLLLKVENNENGILYCSEINKEPMVFNRHSDLNFGLVGVFKDFGKKNIYHRIPVQNVAGKLVRSRGLLMTAPINILIEI